MSFNLPDGCTTDDIDDAAEGRYGATCLDCGHDPCMCGHVWPDED